MPKSEQNRPQIVVTITGPALMAEFVKREVAVALSNIGAFDVTASGEFRNDDDSSQDAKRMRGLLDAAKQGVEIYVEVGDEGD